MMKEGTKLRYGGCLATPPLWIGDGISGYQQIDFGPSQVAANEGTAFQQKRLGKLVEEFVFHRLRQNPDVSWIADNLQIQNGNRTVGELDALYHFDGAPIHLEVAYKFYLYDTSEEHEDPLSRWIGPNRKDRLSYKLAKFHEKQFPLLHDDLSLPYLQKLAVDPKTTTQLLCFKAQLFLPFDAKNISVHPLNKACVVGHHLPFKTLTVLKDCKIHLPPKLDWLVTPHDEVEWCSFEEALSLIKVSLDEGRSPMIWVRGLSSGIGKYFVVFW